MTSRKSKTARPPKVDGKSQARPDAARPPNRNKLAIIDIDAHGAEADRLMAEAQRLCGPSRFIVRSGRGGLHAYYRYNGETRKIKPNPTRAIDILGGGVVVLPPSRGATRCYEVIEGHLDNLTSLTKIKVARVGSIAPGMNFSQLRHVKKGERDEKFWPCVARMAHQARSLDHLVEEAMQMNNLIPGPLTHVEIRAKCKYWWDKTVLGENRFGVGQSVNTLHKVIDTLMMTDPDALVLLTFLRRHHWGREFAVANDTRAPMPKGGWSRPRFAAARTRLTEAGFLTVVKPATFKHLGIYRLPPDASF